MTTKYFNPKIAYKSPKGRERGLGWWFNQTPQSPIFFPNGDIFKVNFGTSSVLGLLIIFCNTNDNLFKNSCYGKFVSQHDRCTGYF